MLKISQKYNVLCVNDEEFSFLVLNSKRGEEMP